MANITSKATTIKVVALGSSELAKQAAKLPSNTWTQLTGVTGQDGAIGIGIAAGGSNDCLTQWTNSWPWNPISKTVECSGNGHGAPGLHYSRYFESSNSFQYFGTVLPAAHGFDHTAVNPYTGDVYFRKYADSGVKLHRKAANSSDLTPITVEPTAGNYNVAVGVTWANAGFLGSGAQGCFVVFSCYGSSPAGSANDGSLAAYDPLKNQWIFAKTGMSPFYYQDGSTETFGQYHDVCEYNPRSNIVIYGGGNHAPNGVWKMDASGVVTKLTNSPVQWGAPRGNVVAHPSNGSFLFYGGRNATEARQLWELNPITDTWTQKASAPATATYAANNSGCTMSSISEYGVIMLISQPAPTGGITHIYKA